VKVKSQMYLPVRIAQASSTNEVHHQLACSCSGN